MKISKKNNNSNHVNRILIKININHKPINIRILVKINMYNQAIKVIKLMNF